MRETIAIAAGVFLLVACSGGGGSPSSMVEPPTGPGGTGGQSDTDGDGVGDVADAFPHDPSETMDSDGDGGGSPVATDPAEATDSDGVGDVADAFPHDAGRTALPKISTSFGATRTDHYPLDARNVKPLPLLEDAPFVDGGFI